MKKTSVVNKYKADFDIYIGRGSKWGNPFKIGIDGDRQTVINLYREWIIHQPQFDDIEELRGKTLGCFCHPLPCHGDVLVEFLDGRSQTRDWLGPEEFIIDDISGDFVSDQSSK